MHPLSKLLVLRTLYCCAVPFTGKRAHVVFAVRQAIDEHVLGLRMGHHDSDVAHYCIN